MRMKMRRSQPDTIPQARWQASTSTVGILHPEVRQVLEGFAQFQAPESRAAFADKWITLVASRLEDIWPVFYQLLKLVETEHLYLRAEVLHDHQPFPTFQAYWESRTGRSFEEWVDLEHTYAYSCTYRPDLLDKLYKVAQKEVVRQRNVAADQVQVRMKGAPARNKNALKHEQETNGSIQEKDRTLCFEKPVRGTTAPYAMRRLKRDRPDLHTQCLAGQMTPHAAMVEAGFRKRPPSRKKTLAQHLEALWAQASLDERLHFLTETVTDLEYSIMRERRAPQKTTPLLHEPVHARQERLW